MNSLRTVFDESQKHTNEELYYRQVELLNTFRERNAISQEQYEKSVRDLNEKMGINRIMKKER